MCMEFPRRESTPKSVSVCKQTHWPRVENWNFSATPTGMNTIEILLVTLGAFQQSGLLQIQILELKNFNHLNEDLDI